MLIIGWLGSMCLAACAIPQAVTAWREEYCRINKWTVRLWFWGEVFTLAYVLHKQDWPLVVNITVNLVCLLVIIKYNDKGEK